MSLTEELERKREAFKKDLGAICMNYSIYIKAEVRMEYVANDEGDIKEINFEVEL